MSSLPPNVLEALGQLIQGLTAGDNTIRQAAEQSLNKEWIGGGRERQELLLVGLAEQAISGDNHTTKAFAAVMFRQIAIRASDSADGSRIIDDLNPAVIDKVRTTVLQGLLSEQPADVRHKISDAISEIARPTEKATPWPELLYALFQGAKSPDAQTRESSFRVFSNIPEVVGESHLTSIIPIFTDGLSDSSEDVRISTIGAFTSFFATLPKSTWRQLHPLLPQLLSVIGPLKEAGKEDELSTVFEYLIELAGLAPKMFKPMFKELVEFCLAVCKNKEFEEKTRNSALELLTTFSETSPNMCKKDDSYTSVMVLLCLELMTEIGENDDEEASEWKNEDDLLSSEDSDEVYTAAKQSLDRLALKLGGKVLLPPLFQWLPQMIDAADWRARHAALMALSNVAEGCRDEMISELDKVLDFVLPKLQDPHPRVQWATCNALGQMSTDFADFIQNNFASRIVPPLISKMDNNSTFRVQAHAAAAMVNFCEQATKEILDPYLDNLLTNLLGLLQSPKRYVQEQVLTTIAIVADAAKTKFIKYYDTMMPMLFNVMGAETNKEHRMLKAKSIEASTLIALAVGKEKFAPHFQQMVQLFAAIQQSCTDDDDPCSTYLPQAWGRLCRIMGHDFLPCLPAVLPPLMRAAKHEPSLAVFEDENSASELDRSDGWEIIPVQGKFLGIHTGLLDEKESAIDLLTIYATELGADFAPYVKGIINEVINPSLKFFYHDGVRYVAAEAVPHLLKCFSDALVRERSNGAEPTPELIAQCQQDPAVLQLWNPVFERMLEALKVDSMPEIMTGFYEGISATIELIGAAALNPNYTARLVEVIEVCLKDYADRVQQRVEAENDDYAEDIEEEEAEAADEELTAEVNKVIHSVFKTHKALFLPYFEKLLPIISSFLHSNNADCRQFAISAIDDLIEFTGSDSWKYKDSFLAKLADALVDGDATVRQVAAYGIGLAAQHGGEPYAQSTVAALETLFNVANVPEARTEENINVTENVSSAIAKILHKNGALLGPENFNKAATEWVKTLPIVSDEEAALAAYMFLADLIDQRNEAVTSQVPRVFEAVSSALTLASIQGKAAARVVESTKGLLSQIPPNEAMSLFNNLPPESQQIVQKWFA